MSSPIRKSLELTAAQWQRLDELAAAVDATAPTGSNAGQPSWRSLVKEIANGTIIISRKESDRDH